MQSCILFNLGDPTKKIILEKKHKNNNLNFIILKIFTLKMFIMYFMKIYLSRGIKIRYFYPKFII